MGNLDDLGLLGTTLAPFVIAFAFLTQGDFLKAGVGDLAAAATDVRLREADGDLLFMGVTTRSFIFPLTPMLECREEYSCLAWSQVQ